MKRRWVLNENPDSRRKGADEELDEVRARMLVKENGAEGIVR